MIEMTGVTRVFDMGGYPVHALAGVTLAIARGEAVAIMGPSGSGKSTLMNIIGCLDRPTAGRYLLAGEDVSHCDRDRLARIRNRRIGFIFQSYNLLPQLTAQENVEVPLIYRGTPAADRRATARAALEAVGLGDRLGHRPSELSGGQQQRVSIARALAAEPEVILADEPTGALDSCAGEEILDLLLDLNARGRTLVVVTHDDGVAKRCRRVIRMRDGRVTAA